MVTRGSLARRLPEVSTLCATAFETKNSLFFEPAVQGGQQLAVKGVALDMIVAPIKRRPNSLHRGQKSGRGLGVTLAFIQSLASATA
jgi:hypothetical protein